MRVLLLDEASHIFASNRSASDYPLHFELLKSFSGGIKCPLVLAGDYNLLEAVQLNGALNRRVKVVHIKRYTAQDLADNTPYGQAFRNLVYTFLMRSPIPFEDGMEEHYEYFLLKSLGSTGLLKEWFDHALIDAWERKDTLITRRTLQKHELSNRRLKRILDEAKLGEKGLEDIDDDVLASCMGMADTPSLYRSETDAAALSQPPSKRKRKVERVGKRGLSRDPIGGGVDATT